MFDGIKKLFGIQQEEQRATQKVPAVVDSPDRRERSGTNGRKTDSYFDSMGKLQSAISDRDYAAAAKFARQNIKLIPSFVREWDHDFGDFAISSIPGLQEGGTILALAGDRSSLLELKNLVESIPELQPWRELADAHFEDLELFTRIFDAVAANPGCLQKDVKTLVGEPDGHRVGRLIGWLEKAKKLRRVKKGATYQLWVHGAEGAPKLRPDRKAAKTSRTGGSRPIREIDLSSLPYVPLPRAPMSWEEKRVGRIPEPVGEVPDLFAVRGEGWHVADIAKVPKADRPDTAFRVFHSYANGLFVIDGLGKADAFPEAPAAAMAYDRRGAIHAVSPLLHDVYRLGVNALGDGIIAMSKDCAIHAYDADLKPILELDLTSLPEVSKLASRWEIDGKNLKNHIRTTSLAHDGSRYLVSAGDEAWCFSIDGQPLWSVKMPVKEGWERIATPSGTWGTSEEIGDALDLMGLSLPLTSEVIKKRYRELAKQWHPDLHPGDAAAEENMKRLTSAVELLTGTQLDAGIETGARYRQNLYKNDIETADGVITISFGFEGGESFAADWIYASGFAGASQSAFIAGYSGRIVKLDAQGTPVRAYDIGSVPTRIVDTGDYLYFMTFTRLYVLRDDALHRIVDTLEGGDLIVTPQGIGLLEKKRFRWFSEAGDFIGAVITKDPIRRVFHDGQQMIVETRQHRAAVLGAPFWWH